MLSLLYLSQHMRFWVPVLHFTSNQGSGKPVQTRISLCYSHTQNMDEDEDWKHNLNLKSCWIR